MEQARQAAQQTSLLWLAADYHFPSTYSCRIPMSSMSSAPVMPTPGPATIRQALIRTGIECFGLEAMRDTLFPILRSVPVRVRPPERVAISQQVLRGYKWHENNAQGNSIQESIIVREMAHAASPMTVFLQVPEDFAQPLRVVLQAVGYWGQSSSLAYCLGVTNSPPIAGESALPLSQLDGTFPLRPYFSCLATEFRSDELSWDDIVPGEDGQVKTEALRLDVYLWPMVIEYRHGTQKLLVRTPFNGSTQ